MHPRRAYFALAALLLAPSPVAAQVGAPPPGTDLPAFSSVVVATRRPTPLDELTDAVHVVTREEIAAAQAASTGELLRRLTGASLESGTGSGLPKRSVVGLNGLPAAYTLVLVDGVRLLSEHAHTGINLEVIPPDALERIEILRGAASAQYGADAIGGVVNLVTRKAARQGHETVLGGSTGSYASQAGHVAVRQALTPWLRLSSFLHREVSDGPPLSAPAHRIGKMNHERLYTSQRLDLDLHPRTAVWAWLSWTDFGAQWQDAQAEASLLNLVAGLRQQLGARAELSAQLSRLRWEAETSAELNRLLQPELWLRVEPWAGHILSAGFDLRQQTFRRTQVVEAEQLALGGFVGYELPLGQRVLVHPALRLDRVDGQDLVLSPKLSALVDLSRWGQLRLTAARGFHAPTPQELHEEGYGHGGRALRFGNPDLEPETSTSLGLGLDLRLHERLAVTFYGHAAWFENLIVPVYEGAWEQDPSHDVWRRRNLATAEIWGGELSLRYRPLERLELTASYGRSEDRDAGERPLPYHPGARASAAVRGDLPLGRHLTLGAHLTGVAVFDRSAWSWKPVAGAADDDSAGLITELADHQLVDLGLDLGYRDQYRLYLRAGNLLGQDLETLDDAYTVIEGERTWRVGLQGTW
ncbi:MAG: TonB-dependent receptor [Myxococcota bacterium]|nr:TonB-dependent receptor [Myxococcota bacterium]